MDKQTEEKIRELKDDIIAGLRRMDTSDAYDVRNTLPKLQIKIDEIEVLARKESDGWKR